MAKPVIFSGIQPTGNLHIGNYLGAVKNWVALQESGDYNCYFCIVDLHSLTGDMSATDRRAQTLRTAAELISAGIDPKKSTLFVQSHIPECTELAWVFNTVTPVTELERMTQFKDKAARQAKNINAGLFTYPTLMAADILLYLGDLVPVGKDQIQHIELTRDIARWFNNRYGDYFPETKPLLTEIPKVMSLLEPTSKMSKSKGEAHIIELADEPEVIAAKVKKAVTATEGGGASPGVENLISLLKHFGGDADAVQFEAAEKSGDIKYSELKDAVSKAISDYFVDFRERRTDLLSNLDDVNDILEKGAKKAQEVAEKTIEEVRYRVGLRSD